jgi:hypothetical protein
MDKLENLIEKVGIIAANTLRNAGHRELAKCCVEAASALRQEPYKPMQTNSLALNVGHPDHLKAADAFWKYWKENGETHKHGYYESTWGAINAAIRLVGVVPHNYAAPPVREAELTAPAPYRSHVAGGSMSGGKMEDSSPCGFDRASSLSEDRYICTCGEHEVPAYDEATIKARDQSPASETPETDTFHDNNLHITDVVALHEGWHKFCGDIECSRNELAVSALRLATQEPATWQFRSFSDPLVPPPAPASETPETDAVQNSADGIGLQRNALLALSRDLERSRNALKKENSVLRGLVQHNPAWKCTYGHQIDSMAKCPQGFPGCGCADDLMCGEDEAFKAVVAEGNVLIARLAQEEAGHKRSLHRWNEEVLELDQKLARICELHKGLMKAADERVEKAETRLKEAEHYTPLAYTELQKFYEEWPGGLEEIEASLKGWRKKTKQAEAAWTRLEEDVRRRSKAYNELSEKLEEAEAALAETQKILAFDRDQWNLAVQDAEEARAQLAQVKADERKRCASLAEDYMISLSWSGDEIRRLILQDGKL